MQYGKRKNEQTKTPKQIKPTTSRKKNKNKNPYFQTQKPQVQLSKETISGTSDAGASVWSAQEWVQGHGGNSSRDGTHRREPRAGGGVLVCAAVPGVHQVHSSLHRQGQRSYFSCDLTPSVTKISRTVSHSFTWSEKWSRSVVSDSLRPPGECSLPGSSIHGIFQARVLEWVATSFSRRSSRPRVWTQGFHVVGRHFTVWATREARVHLFGKHKTLGSGVSPLVESCLHLWLAMWL